MQSVLGKFQLQKQQLPDLSGRVALVTGGALGIGHEISRALALSGARVIMINRKDQEAVENIKKESDGKVQIEWTPCDFGCLGEVQEVFSRIRTTEKRLDLLFLNAGINSNSYGLDADGIERTFGVNWLGHYYALNLLYPLLRSTSKLPGAPAPRIVFESSELHRWAPKETKFNSIKDINDQKLSPVELHGRTKLAMILAAKFCLARGVIARNGDHIYALSVHPAAVNTPMQEQWKDAYPGVTGQVITNATTILGSDVEQGSYSTLYAATNPEVEDNDWNGVYLSDPGTLAEESDQANDPELAKALWELSEKFVRDRVGEDALLAWDE